MAPRALGIAFIGLLALYAGMTVLSNNFHVVLPKELYRSGQFKQGDIEAYVKRYGLRSVINLRGDNTGSPWYDQEIAEAKAAQITHIDYRMSAKKQLTREEALELIKLMRNAPKPLLVHCNGGANRTSLAVALYLAAVTKADERTAESQMSIRFGNFPTWLGSKSQMNATFENLEDMFGYDTMDL